MPQAVGSFRKEFAHRRQGKRTEPRQPHLTAVSVAAQHQVEIGRPAVIYNGYCVIRFVHHHYHRRLRLFGHGQRKVRDARRNVVKPGEEKVLAAAFDADELILQQRDAVILHVVSHHAPADHHIVVAEHAETLRAGETAKQSPAMRGCLERNLHRQRSPAHEVARNEYHVGAERVHPRDHFAQEEVLRVFLQVDVGDLHNAKAIEAGRQTVQSERALGHLQLMPSDLVRVQRNQGRRGERAGKKLATTHQPGSGRPVRSRSVVGRKGAHTP